MTLSVGVNTNVLYKGYFAVFAPVVSAGFSVPLAGDLFLGGSADLRFGYRYFAENQPRGFGPEFLLMDVGIRYAASPGSEWLFGIETDMDFNEFVTRFALIPRIEWTGRTGDLFSGGLGIGFDFHPGCSDYNTLLVSGRLNLDLSGLLPWDMGISYEGEGGVRLNDYTYRVVNPTPTSSEDMFLSSKESKPYFSRYAEELTVDFPIGETVLFRYHVGNQFVFIRRFSQGTPSLVLSEDESLKTLFFSMDFILTY
jgi:hypothetical protein